MDVVVGLCAGCRHSRIVESRRGARFWYCRLSEVNEAFVKYPTLPVRRCDGYRPAGERER